MGSVTESQIFMIQDTHKLQELVQIATSSFVIYDNYF